MTKAHEDEVWFYKDLGRQEAEDVLRNIPITGAFLVRYAQGGSRFAISFRSPIIQKSNSECYYNLVWFRYEQQIKHCRVQEDGRLLLVSTKTFETITDLINYYRKNTFFKGIRLEQPVTEELYRSSQTLEVEFCMMGSSNQVKITLRVWMQESGIPVYSHAGYYEISNQVRILTYRLITLYCCLNN